MLNFLYPKGGSAGGAGKRSTQATIVVQQPSLSLDAPAATILLHPDADARRREENMRQLLDVANTLTLQEIHDFEMRWANDRNRDRPQLRNPRFLDIRQENDTGRSRESHKDLNVQRGCNVTNGWCLAKYSLSTLKFLIWLYLLTRIKFCLGEN